MARAHDGNLYQTWRTSNPDRKIKKYRKLIIRGDHKWVMMFTFSALSGKKKNCFDLVSKTKTNTNMIKINIAVQYIVTYAVK